RGVFCGVLGGGAPRGRLWVKGGVDRAGSRLSGNALAPMRREDDVCDVRWGVIPYGSLKCPKRALRAAVEDDPVQPMLRAVGILAGFQHRVSLLQGMERPRRLLRHQRIQLRVAEQRE